MRGILPPSCGEGRSSGAKATQIIASWYKRIFRISESGRPPVLTGQNDPPLSRNLRDSGASALTPSVRRVARRLSRGSHPGRGPGYLSVSGGRLRLRWLALTSKDQLSPAMDQADRLSVHEPMDECKQSYVKERVSLFFSKMSKSYRSLNFASADSRPTLAVRVGNRSRQCNLVRRSPSGWV